MSDVKFTDNSGKVLDELDEKMQLALATIGRTAERKAKKVLTRTVYSGDRPWQLTGRLRNSIAYATATAVGGEQAYGDDGTPRGKPDKDEVYIGTNVEYAIGIETGTRRKAGAVHFLMDAAANHGEEYKKLAKQILES